MSEAEFRELLDRWCNGRLDDEGFALLQEGLRDSTERRREFLRVSNLDSGMRDLAERAGETAWTETGAAPVKPGRVVSLSTVSWFAAAAAVALSALVFLLPFQRGDEEAMGRGYAILTRSFDAEWEGSSPEPGEVLPAGILKLRKGLAQVEFFGGATLVLEGPGELEIRSATEAYCASGRVRASVPPAARGFVIETPEGRIVDLGTEFGLAVGPDRKQEVHVFDGKVELHDGRGAVREILGGKAVTPSGEGAAAEEAFVGAEDLDGQLALSNDDRFARWREHSRELRRDPRLLVYYPMDQPGTWQRRLLNESPAGPEGDGAVVGANRVQGRWTGVGKSALEFTPTGSRARMVIPGEYSSVTLACWVRIESLDRQYNALYLTDNYQPGEVHWQLHEDGRILFSILVRKGLNLMSWSPPVWDLSDSGKWMHLAAVFDEPAQEIRHYRNGRLVFSDPVPGSHEVRTTRFGSGEIGNWGLPHRPENPWFAIRNLNGRIDEFAIFSDALSGEEIAEMHRIGKPR